jgi:hypothetical protein
MEKIRRMFLETEQIKHQKSLIGVINKGNVIPVLTI